MGLRRISNMAETTKQYRTVGLAAIFVAGIALSGCAVESIPYPTLSTPKKLKDRILSRDEREEVIRDLSAEQASHQSTAIKEIEKAP